nr:MAG TPA: baseplate assembly protein [Caudoviricetes sp.]
MTTQLPEPNFINRDPDLITQEWIKYYEEKSGKTLYPAQIDRLRIDLGAYRETVLRIQVQEAAKKQLLSYAPLDILEHIGEPLGVNKLLADFSTTVLKFSVDEPLDFDFVIDAGAEVETKDGLFIFKTVSAVILKAGSLSILADAICETSGIAANNYSIGSINNLITPLSYISSVENTTVSAGGADDETADQLRERIRQAPEKFSNAGSIGAYRYHTLSAHQSIIDVAITSPSPGTVYVYPLTSDGNPSLELIKLVQNYLSDDKIRPLTDYVVVVCPEKIEFSINADILLYKDADSTSVIKTIEAKMKEYKVSLSEKLGKDVIRTQIIAILNSVYGVFKVDLKMSADIEIAEYQWADLTNYDITIGGYADE